MAAVEFERNDEMTETLSVVIPVYNAENYIRRAIDSVLSQTWRVYEIVCVDDGSTDGSLCILNEYAERDGRIKIIHKENGGSTSARKAGVQHAKGDYITFVDADDFMEPQMYEEMMALAVRHKADLVTSGLIRDYGTNVTVNSEKLEAGVYKAGENKKDMLRTLIDTEHFYRANISPSLCNKIFRTEDFRAVQMEVDDRVAVGDDDAVVYPFLFGAKTVVVSKKSYYHYCIRESGSNIDVRRKNEEEAYQILFCHLERVFREADGPGLNLMKQFQILKTYFLMLKFPSKVLKYDRGVLYPFGEIRREARILLYGAGKFGAAMKEYLEEEGFEVVGWMDKSANRPGVIRPDEMQGLDFDRIVITVLVSDAVEQIRKELKIMGIPAANILYVNAGMAGCDQ